MKASSRLPDDPLKQACVDMYVVKETTGTGGVNGKYVLMKLVGRGEAHTDLYECCGKRQMVHMDIKSANVLLQDKTCRVAKIADLGVSRYLVEGSLLDYTLRGAMINSQVEGSTTSAWSEYMAANDMRAVLHQVQLPTWRRSRRQA